MKLKLILTTSLLALTACSSLSARIWKSTAGVEIEAEYISSTETSVTIKRTKDFRRFTFPIDKLSAEDQQWLIDKALEAPAETPELYEGIPKKLIPILKSRGKLLFEDDFNRDDPDDKEQLGEHWKSLSDATAQGEKQCDFVDNALEMTLSPKANHVINISHTTSEPYKDAISWFRAKFSSGNRLKIAFNDKQYKPVHAGHINGVLVKETSVNIVDEKNGAYSPAAKAMRGDPSKAEESKELAKKYTRTFPASVNPDKWFEVVTHHDGETLTVYIDGSEVGSYTSPGFAHETKRQVAFSPNKNATVDHFRIWSLKPAASEE